MTRKELAGKLRAMADYMDEVACDIDYFSGFDLIMQQHSKELSGASAIARDWAVNLDEVKDGMARDS